MAQGRHSSKLVGWDISRWSKSWCLLVQTLTPRAVWVYRGGVGTVYRGGVGTEYRGGVGTVYRGGAFWEVSGEVWPPARGLLLGSCFCEIMFLYSFIVYLFIHSF